MKLVEFVPPTPHPLWKLCPQMGITDVIVKVNPELTGLADPWRLSTLRSIVERLKVEGLNVVGLEGDPFDMTPIKEYGAAEDFSRKERKDRKDEFRTNDNSSQITNSNVAFATGSLGVLENMASTSILQDSKTPSSDSNLNPANPVKDDAATLREEALSHYRELLESMGRLGIKLLCYNFMVGKGWSRTGVREGRGAQKRQDRLQGRRRHGGGAYAAGARGRGQVSRRAHVRLHPARLRPVRAARGRTSAR